MGPFWLMGVLQDGGKVGFRMRAMVRKEEMVTGGKGGACKSLGSHEDNGKEGKD